jgi:hypothetical protein
MTPRFVLLWSFLLATIIGGIVGSVAVIISYFVVLILIAILWPSLFAKPPK